jgi:hypothetical protein
LTTVPEALPTHVPIFLAPPIKSPDSASILISSKVFSKNALYRSIKNWQFLGETSLAQTFFLAFSPIQFGKSKSLFHVS